MSVGKINLIRARLKQEYDEFRKWHDRRMERGDTKLICWMGVQETKLFNDGWDD